MKLKTIDRLILGSLLPPFVASFFIALFVLMMQFLWLWIDDIIGKGVDILIILELLGYLLIYLIPSSIPIAILIAGVMVFGNLAENYELSSMKSAGISLVRVMRMAIFFGLFCAVLTYVSANYLVPYANLKYKTRLFDIKKQKPTLNISPGIFNYDFQGYTIRVQGKSKNNRDLEGVLIYDYSQSNPSNINMITARRGEMYTSENNRYLIMMLYDGYQVQETTNTGQGADAPSSFIRTTFTSWEKKFDLSEFEISRSEEDVFKTHQDMMSGAQLLEVIDTFKMDIESFHASSRKDLSRDLPNWFSAEASTDIERQRRESITINEDEFYLQTDSLVEGGSFLSLFREDFIPQVISLSRFRIQDSKSRMMVTSSSVIGTRENIAKHIFSHQSKWSNAFICVVFLIIGASLGAIVRKGGFGYPLLTAIVFFMIFISLNTSYKKLAETLSTNAAFAAWAPVVYLLPLAGLFMYMAQRDIKLPLSAIINFFKRPMKYIKNKP